MLKICVPYAKFAKTKKKKMAAQCTVKDITAYTHANTYRLAYACMYACTRGYARTDIEF